MITNRALAVIKNNLAATRFINRQYDSSFAQAGAKIGDTLNIRKPPRFKGRTGNALAVEDAVETSTPLKLTTLRGCDIEFNDVDLLLSIDDFSRRFIEPQVASVVNAVDADVLSLMASSTYNSVNSIGAAPTKRTALLAGAMLDSNGAPKGSGLRGMIVDPYTQVEIVDTLTSLYNDQNKLSQQFRRGNMVDDVLGFDWSMDQNVQKHTVGPLGGAPLVNGAGQTGNTLNTDGWTAAAGLRLNAGDVFTITGVYGVNPQNRQTTGQLQQFVATAAANSDGTGASALAISPAITPTGQFQNVTNAPADNAVITVVGAAGSTYTVNIACSPDAFTLACADLEIPKGVDMAARAQDKDSGLSLRMVRAYDIRTNTRPCRLDILYGVAPLYPEWSTRLAFQPAA